MQASLEIVVQSLPLLDLGVLVTRFPRPLADVTASDWLVDFLRADAPSPIPAAAATAQAVRDLLRAGGYRPSGRGRPASEFLAKAAQAGTLGPINPAVDACNAVSLHSGLPISVIALERARPPFVVRIADPDARYVFNRSGQEIALGGLSCLHDADGPCGNPVKDSQRTKTSEQTTDTLSLVWGTKALPGHTERAMRWYREVLERLGAQVERLEPVHHPAEN